MLPSIILNCFFLTKTCEIYIGILLEQGNDDPFLFFYRKFVKLNGTRKLKHS